MKKVTAFLGLCLMVMLVFSLPAEAADQSALGDIRDANGKSLGQITMTEDASGTVRVSVKFNDIAPGAHGIHIHTVGKCDGPDFMTAGAHFNPDGKQHGYLNPAGPHAGDLGSANLISPAGGSGTLDVTTKLLTLSAGPRSIFDTDGSALIIHANEDDFKTDPTGNSGGRIGCAILRAASLPGAAPATGAGGAGESVSGYLFALLAIGGLAVVGTGAALVLRHKASR